MTRRCELGLEDLAAIDAETRADLARVTRRWASASTSGRELIGSIVAEWLSPGASRSLTSQAIEALRAAREEE